MRPYPGSGGRAESGFRIQATVTGVAGRLTVGGDDTVGKNQEWPRVCAERGGDGAVGRVEQGTSRAAYPRLRRGQRDVRVETKADDEPFLHCVRQRVDG